MHKVTIRLAPWGRDKPVARGEMGVCIVRGIKIDDVFVSEIVGEAKAVLVLDEWAVLEIANPRPELLYAFGPDAVLADSTAELLRIGFTDLAIEWDEEAT